MRNNPIEFVPKRIGKRINIIKYAAVLMLAVVFTITGGYHNVSAAPLEDCDLDGFDDATGVPVPWPGYDETKGDTPDGPGGGSTSTTEPGSMSNASNGNSNSGENGAGGTTGHSTVDNGNGSSDKTQSQTTGNSSNQTVGSTTDQATGSTTNDGLGSTTNGSTDSTTNGKTESTTVVTTGTSVGKTESANGNTGNTTNGATNGSTSQAADNNKSKNTNRETSGGTGSTAVGNTGGSTSSNTVSSTTGNTGNTTAGNISNSSEDNNESVTSSKDANTNESGDAKGVLTIGGTDNVVSDGTINSATGTPSNLEGDSQAEANQAYSGNVNNNMEISSEESDAIINTKGTLDIKEVTGSLPHAGSTLTITGYGFQGSINSLDILIQSETQVLGTVTSTQEGSFETQVIIPEDLKAGSHHIVVQYQGKEITHQLLEIGPKPADSFLQALTVGFTADNIGLIPGLIILGGLLILGSVTLLVSTLVQSKDRRLDRGAVPIDTI